MDVSTDARVVLQMGGRSQSVASILAARHQRFPPDGHAYGGENDTNTAAENFAWFFIMERIGRVLSH